MYTYIYIYIHIYIYTHIHESGSLALCYPENGRIYTQTRDCAESADLYSGRYPQDILFTQAPGMRILSFSRYVQFLEAMEPQVRVSQNHVGAWKVDPQIARASPTGDRSMCSDLSFVGGVSKFLCFDRF